MDCAKLVEKSAHPRVVAIGETGLDYYYDKSDRAQQCTGFREHIKASRETGLPIIIHTRDAEADTAAILTEEMREGAFTGVIHCFTASAAFARIALDLGMYISLSGIVTFKNAQDLQDVAKWLPEDRFLVETDAPFLAPIPHRGRTGEPAFVADTACFVAQLRGVAPEILAQQTSDNFYNLFSKAIR
jgi:TatD DNase family protein